MRHAAAALGMALTMLVAAGSVAADDPSELDRQLLEQLDAADDPRELLTEPQEGEAPRPSADDSGAPHPEKSLDQKLLDQLGEGEDIPLQTDLVEEEVLGEDADPLTRIGHKMRLVQRLLVQQKPPSRAGQLQQEILRDLEKLLEQLQQQQQQQASAPRAGSGRQQASRRKIQQPRPGSPRRGGDRPSRQPADQSEDRVREAESRQIDVVEVTEMIKQIWGHLPEKERERLRQMAADEPLPESAVQIENYFRRLSEAEGP